MGLRRAAPGEERRAIGRLIREYILPQWRFFSFAILLMLVVAATTTYTTFLIGPAVENMFPSEGGGDLSRIVPGLPSIAPEAGEGPNFAAILWIALQAGVGLLLLAAATYGHSLLIAVAGVRIVNELQTRLYAHILDFDLGRLGMTHSGRLASSILADTASIRWSVSNAVTEIFKNGMTAVSLIVVLFIAHWKIALMATVVLPILVLILKNLVRQLKKLTQRRLVEAGTMTSVLMESLDGIRIVKAYGQEEREVERMRDSLARLRKLEVKSQRIQQFVGPVTEALSSLTVPLIIVYGGYEAIYGDLSAGQLVVVIAAAMRAYQPLKSLSRMQLILTEGMTAARRVFAILNEPPAIVDAPHARALSPVRGRIVFDDVHFVYPDGTKALDGLSLIVEPGQKAALVGPSGAGKTTILNLIPRFYDVSAGAIRIDGVDLREVTIASLRRQLALVTQEPFLFDDTVRMNVAYGRASASEEEIRTALAAANAEEFVARLAGGLDARVGEQGSRLSGGQRQRLAIARAMLRDAPVLLLDEATSSLDSESERTVQLALNKLMAGRTSIIIAHRLSTIMDADIIIVIDDGRVVEQGTHAELLAEDGLYARLYRTQFERAGDALALTEA